MTSATPFRSFVKRHHVLYILGLVIAAVTLFFCMYTDKLIFIGHVTGLSTLVGPSIQNANKYVVYDNNTRSDEEDDLEKWGLMQQERRFRMLSVCRDMNFTDKLPDMNFVYYDEHSRAMYCSIPKIGCSFWKQIMYVMMTDQKINPLSLSSTSIHSIISRFAFSKVPISTQYKNLLSATKFLFIRDPYTRLFSAYLDKLFSLSQGTTQMISHHINMFIRGWKKASSRRSRSESTTGSTISSPTTRTWNFNASFSEALLYASGSWKNFRDFGQVNRHFRPTYGMCNPCTVQYDFIGKMETFEEDAVHFLKFLRRSDILERIGDMDNASDEDIISSMVGRVMSSFKKMKSTSTKDLYLRKLWKTLQCRGLISDSKDFPLTVAESERVQKDDFKAVALQAFRTSEDRTTRRLQRKRCYLEAFRGVPLWVLRRFQKSVEKDCKVFGYDCEPEELFAGRVDGDEIDNVFSNELLIYKTSG